MKLAYRRAIYRHNYRVVDQAFPWLDGKARRDFVRKVGPILANCGDPECPVCRPRPTFLDATAPDPATGKGKATTEQPIPSDSTGLE